jgi:hypothetical protein
MFAKPRYFSRDIGLARPAGKNVYEVLVVWNYELGSLARILDVFASNRAKVLLVNSSVDAENQATGAIYCDLTTSDQKINGIRKSIKELSFVKLVDSASAESSLFDKFLFPVTVWGKQRVIVMRMNPLLNIERRITDELGSAGGAIMFREGEAYASETFDQYKRALPSASNEVLLETMQDGLRATGWGLFQFKPTNDGYEVIVRDAPMFLGGKEPSRFLCGIIAGILESLYSTKMKIVESVADNDQVLIRLSKLTDGSKS